MNKAEFKMADVLTGAPIGIIYLLADKNHPWALKIGPMLRRSNILAKNVKSEELTLKDDLTWNAVEIGVT